MTHSILGMGGILSLPFIVILIAGVAIVGALLSVRKVKAGESGVRTGLGGLKVTKDWMLRMPFVHRWDVMDITIQKLVIMQKGKNGLIWRDNIRADIEAAFHVRVHPDEENIKEVAVAVGADRASDNGILRELFEGMFSDVMRATAKQVEFADMYTQRVEFREKIKGSIGTDLYGYELKDVVIDYLEQTPNKDHDPDNILDTESIKKIKDITAEQSELTEERTLKMEEEVEMQNLQAAEEKRGHESRNEEDKAAKQRQIEETRAREVTEARNATESNLNEQRQADLRKHYMDELGKSTEEGSK